MITFVKAELQSILIAFQITQGIISLHVIIVENDNSQIISAIKGYLISW